MNESRGKRFIGALALIFLSGVGVGVLAGHFFFSPPPEDPQDLRLARLSKELDLSSEQKDRIKEILVRNRKHFMEIKQNLDPQVAVLKEQMRKEIQSILTPEQQKRLDAILERLKSTEESAMVLPPPQSPPRDHPQVSGLL